jgi:hypothetical protein
MLTYKQASPAAFNRTQALAIAFFAFFYLLECQK